MRGRVLSRASPRISRVMAMTRPFPEADQQLCMPRWDKLTSWMCTLGEWGGGWGVGDNANGRDCRARGRRMWVGRRWEGGGGGGTSLNPLHENRIMLFTHPHPPPQGRRRRRRRKNHNYVRVLGMWSGGRGNVRSVYSRRLPLSPFLSAMESIPVHGDSEKALWLFIQHSSQTHSWPYV